jgi:hypothetical protein
MFGLAEIKQKKLKNKRESHQSLDNQFQQHHSQYQFFSKCSSSCKTRSFFAKISKKIKKSEIIFCKAAKLA